MSKATKVSCVSDLLKAIEQDDCFHDVSGGITRDLWGGHVRIWFRGQADASWKLEPLVYRAGLQDKEDLIINKERHLAQDFESFGAALLAERATDADIYFTMQHYRMPTRLLDWSGNPLAALYFATEESARDTEDGKIFAVDSYVFKGGHHTRRHGELLKALASIFDWKDNCWPKEIMAVRPPMRDARIVAQSSYFTFHPPGRRYLETSSNKTLREYLIPRGAKKGIRKELARMNINEFTIFGGLDHLGNWLRAAYRRRSLSGIAPRPRGDGA